MDESTPSRTALMTSLIRALHSHYDSAPLLDDPWGDRLVPQSARGELRQYILAAMDSDARAAALRAPDSILDDYLRAFDAIVVIRSRYTEDALKEAVERGTRQYVLIGAGFDSFALRRPAFSPEPADNQGYGRCAMVFDPIAVQPYLTLDEVMAAKKARASPAVAAWWAFLPWPRSHRQSAAQFWSRMCRAAR